MKFPLNLYIVIKIKPPLLSTSVRAHTWHVSTVACLYACICMHTGSSQRLMSGLATLASKLASQSLVLQAGHYSHSAFPWVLGIQTPVSRLAWASALPTEPLSPQPQTILESANSAETTRQ